MIGTVIGSYRITEELGDGGVGPVFRAVDAASGREIAVRFFASDVTRETALVERLRAMVPLLQRLRHPNLAAMYGLVEEGAHLGFSLEHVAGVSLDRARSQVGRMDTSVAVSHVLEMLQGLDHAHRAGVFHHALRPTNLMVTPQGTIKVMDIGIGHALGANRKTREDRLLGVLAYLAPEHVRNQPGDARSDIYAAGVILYELLTGRRPFAHETEFNAMRQAVLREPAAPPRTLVAGIPEWAEQVLMRALAKNPAERYQSVTEMHAVLEAGLRLLTLGSAGTVHDASGPGMPTVVMAAAPSVRQAVAAATPPAPGQSDATVLLTRPPTVMTPVPPPAPLPGEPLDATVGRPAAPFVTPNALLLMMMRTISPKPSVTIAR